MIEDRRAWVYADFNGLLERDLLCLAHRDTVQDRQGRAVSLTEGLELTAYDEDANETGRPDAIFATGRVERSPEYARHRGSVWALRIDDDGIRHESDLNPTA